MKKANIQITKEQIENSKTQYRFVYESGPMVKSMIYGDTYAAHPSDFTRWNCYVTKEGRRKWTAWFYILPAGQFSGACERVGLNQTFTRRIDAARAGSIAKELLSK